MPKKKEVNLLKGWQTFREMGNSCIMQIQQLTKKQKQIFEIVNFKATLTSG